MHIPHEEQSNEETWKTQRQEGHSGVNCFDSLLWQINNTEKFKVGMEVIKGHVPEDAYNFLTETHSVSDCAALQFKYDHHGVLSLHSVGV